MNKYFFLIFSLSFTTLTLAKIPGHWKLVRNGEDAKVWTLDKESKVTAAFQTTLLKQGIDWSKIDSKNFFKKFGENKKKSLAVIGVKDWQVSNQSWKKTDVGYELIAEGSYIDPAGQKIFFKETQVYQSKKTFQILNTWPEAFQKGLEYSDEFVQNLRQENIEI